MSPRADRTGGRLPVDPDTAVRAGPASGRHRADWVLAVVVGFGGAVGALARYAVLWVMPTVTGAFPWGTFTINLSGSAVLGFLLVMVTEAFPRGRLARPLIGTGVIGAYTTFSTFCVEAVQLFRAGAPAVAGAYLAGSLAGGLGAAWLAMGVARIALRAERWLQEELE